MYSKSFLVRVKFLFRLFKIFIFLLELIKPFESQLLFLITFNFYLLYGIVVSRENRKISINAFKELFTSLWLNMLFRYSSDSKFLNSYILLLLFANCLLRTILSLLFPLPVYIFTTCARWSEKPKCATDSCSSELSLFVTVSSIKDSELGVILVGDLILYLLDCKSLIDF